jgi:hypothetical protein
MKSSIIKGGKEPQDDLCAPQLTLQQIADSNPDCFGPVRVEIALHELL